MPALTGDLVHAQELVVVLVGLLLLAQQAGGELLAEELRLDRDLHVELVLLAPEVVAQGPPELEDLLPLEEVELEQDPVEGEVAPAVPRLLLELQRAVEVGVGDQSAAANRSREAPIRAGGESHGSVLPDVWF